MIWVIKILKILLLSVEKILLFLCIYLTVALIGITFSVNSSYDKSKGEIEMYVISNGVHTDICLPVVTPMIDWTKTIDPGVYSGLNEKPKYIAIGWGDKGFYLDTPTWSDLSFKTAFNAAFLPGPTAMHVYYKTNAPIEGEAVKYCPITRDKYVLLIDFINKSFLKNKGEKPMLIPNRGYTSLDNFYEANGNYHLFKTCNTWTNKALSIAGVKTSLLALFDKGILRHL